jgi:hypothetical protein
LSKNGGINVGDIWLKALVVLRRWKMEDSKKTVPFIGKIELGDMAAMFLNEMDAFIQKLEERKGQTINNYKGGKSNMELAAELEDIHSNFKEVAGKFRVIDFVMRVRQKKDADNWSEIVRENRLLLLQARRTWTKLKRLYKKFYHDWQMDCLATYCKDCRFYHICPYDLGTPRWKFLNCQFNVPLLQPN